VALVLGRGATLVSVDDGCKGMGDAEFTEAVVRAADRELAMPLCGEDVVGDEKEWYLISRACIRGATPAAWKRELLAPTRKYLLEAVFDNEDDCNCAHMINTHICFAKHVLSKGSCTYNVLYIA
jgi:hypothetical protein